MAGTTKQRKRTDDPEFYREKFKRYNTKQIRDEIDGQIVLRGMIRGRLKDVKRGTDQHRRMKRQLKDKDRKIEYLRDLLSDKMAEG